MPWALFDILGSLPAFALVLFRMGGLVMTAPLFSSAAVPTRIKAALAMTASAMIFPLATRNAPAGMNLAALVSGGIGEILIGMSIGLAVSMFLIGADTAGRLIGQQAGLALGEVVDPTQGQRTSILGQIYTITLTLVFLGAGGHRAVMAALLDSYRAVPMLSFSLDDSVMLLMAEMMTAAFVFGFRLAGPALIALFLTGTAMGFISRTMPQLNILSVGFTVRVLVAIGAAGLALSACDDLFINALWDVLESIRLTFGLDPNRVVLGR